MTDSLPDFEAPMTEPEAPAPKKARRKPTKRRKQSARPSIEAKPKKRRKSARAKVDRRTKAFRQQKEAVGAIASMQHKLFGPKSGEAETVLAILDRLASYDSEVKKRILARVGQLA